LDVEILLKDSDTLLVQKCDITRDEEVDTAVSRILEKFGRIDVLVNCAGISHVAHVNDLELEDMQNVYDVNVKGTINTCKAVLGAMKEQGFGHIFNIGSLRGINYGKGKAAYGMSKASVIAFSKTLAREVEEYGIKVTVINPGFVDTDIYGDISLRPFVGNIPGVLEQASLTQPSDIAKTILYLLDLSPGACVEELNIGKLWGFE